MLIIPFRDLFCPHLLCFRREKAGGQTWEMYVEVCGRDLGVLLTGYICKASRMAGAAALSSSI